MRASQIDLKLVDLAPSELQAGVLYVSEKYQTGLHLCCCGCGERVVTPLSPAEWQLRVQRGNASLTPSIGNFGMACKSHYWIRAGRVVWSGAMTSAQIAAAQARDKRDLELLVRGGRVPPSPAALAPKRPWYLRFVSWFTGRD